MVVLCWCGSHGGKTSCAAVWGGCQGCSAVDITLKSSVEGTLLEQVPELTGVVDHTDHSFTENAYYTYPTF